MRSASRWRAQLARRDGGFHEFVLRGVLAAMSSICRSQVFHRRGGEPAKRRDQPAHQLRRELLETVLDPPPGPMSNMLRTSIIGGDALGARDQAKRKPQVGGSATH